MNKLLVAVLSLLVFTLQAPLFAQDLDDNKLSQSKTGRILNRIFNPNQNTYNGNGENYRYNNRQNQSSRRRTNNNRNRTRSRYNNY